MKNRILITTMIGFSLMACKKESKMTSENSTPTINSLQMDESKSFTYLATDANRANLTFQNEGNDHTITIKANNMKYVLDKKEDKPNAELYERNGVKAKLTKDSLIITQDNTVISLALEKM